MVSGLFFALEMVSLVLEKANDILFVSHYGAAVGRGHLSRMNYLQQEMAAKADLKGASLSLSVVDSAEFLQSLKGQPPNQIQTPVLASTIKGIISSQALNVILDIPWDRFASTEVIKFIEAIPQGVKITCVDGPLFDINRNVRKVFPSISRPNTNDRFSEVSWGSQYVLAKRRDTNWFWEPGPKWLVLTGSTENDKYAPLFAEHLSSRARSVHEFQWALGSEASPELKRAANDLKFLPVPPEDFDHQQTTASYSICRFGVSALEMLALGIPTIILPGWTSKENGEIAEIKAERIAIVLDDWDQLGPAVDFLTTDAALASAFSSSCVNYFGFKSEPDWSERFTSLFLHS